MHPTVQTPDRSILIKKLFKRPMAWKEPIMKGFQSKKIGCFSEYYVPRSTLSVGSSTQVEPM